MQICSCVGETISSTCPENIPDEYIPLHFQKTTNENQVLLKYRCRLLKVANTFCSLLQQMLMHLYFYAILEKLQDYQYSPAQLVKMIQRTEKVYMYIVAGCL